MHVRNGRCRMRCLKDPSSGVYRKNQSARKTHSNLQSKYLFLHRENEPVSGTTPNPGRPCWSGRQSRDQRQPARRKPARLVRRWRRGRVGHIGSQAAADTAIRATGSSISAFMLLECSYCMGFLLQLDDGHAFFNHGFWMPVDLARSLIALSNPKCLSLSGEQMKTKRCGENISPHRG